MLRVEKRHEISLPMLAGEDAQQFWIAEQVVGGPLWHIQVLQANDDPAQRLWITYLATRPGYAALLISDHHWESVRVNMLLPAGMTKTGQLAIAKCQRWWRCCRVDDESRACWLFETDMGNFVDSSNQIDSKDVRKLALCWQRDFSKK